MGAAQPAGLLKAQEIFRTAKDRKILALGEHFANLLKIRAQADEALRSTLGGSFEDVYAAIIALCDRGEDMIKRKSLAGIIADLREKRDAATADLDMWHRLNDQLTDAQAQLLAIDQRPWDLPGEPH